MGVILCRGSLLFHFVSHGDHGEHGGAVALDVELCLFQGPLYTDADASASRLCLLGE